MAQFLIYLSGGVCFLSLIVFALYAFKNVRATRGRLEHRLTFAGAVSFIFSFLAGIFEIRFFPDSHAFLALAIWLLGLLILVVREVLKWKRLRSIYAGSLARTWGLYIETRHYLVSSSLFLLLAVPLWALVVFEPFDVLVSALGVAATTAWALAAVNLAIGERQFYHKTKPHEVTSTRKSVASGKRDALVIQAFNDFLNLFVAETRPIATSPATRTIAECFESNPILFEGCLTGNDGRVVLEPVLANLTKIPDENRMTALYQSFSMIVARLIRVYSSVVSSEWAEKTVEDCYRSIERQFRNTSAVPDILKAMPKGALENEKLAFLSKEELEVRVKERTSELEESRDQLRMLKDFHEQIVKKAPVGIIRTDKEGKVVFANPKAGETLGLATKDAQVIAEETASAVSNILAAARAAGFNIERFKDMEHQGSGTAQEEFYTNLAFTSSSGKGIQTSIAIVRLADKSGKFDGQLLIIEDVTARTALEEERRRIDKLSSLGTLAGGIAHDFNNLLAGIMGNIGLAKMVMDRGTKAFEILKEAETASVRAKSLTQQLLTFSKGGLPVKKAISLDDLLRESASFALRGTNIRPVFAIADDLWPVNADEGQINQVIINVSRNANEAMPDGGTLEITARNIVLRERGVLPLAEGKYVKVTVKDHGSGIRKDDLPKLFEPYFSTKQRGSGLGLATCYSIVKNHNGHISIASDLGIGTRVYIYLPASEKPVPGKMEKAPEVRRQGKGRILVMDDDDMIRQMLRRMLEVLGYEAQLAQNGEEAIKQYSVARESRRAFDAIIMDLTVPGGMGGREALQKLLEMDPKVKAIVSSGYTGDGLMAEHEKYGFRGVITKPYTIDEVDTVLFSVLSEASNPVASP